MIDLANIANCTISGPVRQPLTCFFRQLIAAAPFMGAEWDSLGEMPKPP
jgi:hypothetical protein